jgi:hypothetical protein
MSMLHKTILIGGGLHYRQERQTEPLSEADDVAAAKKQVAAMAKATTTLKAATDKAEQESAGYRAVSVIPTLKQHHAVAMVRVLGMKTD